MPFLDLLPQYELTFPTQQCNPDQTKYSATPIVVRTTILIPQSINKATTEAYFEADHHRPAGTFLENPLHPIITRIR